MQLIERQHNNHTIKIMVISHTFKGYPNIICSGGKIYQLPTQIGKKSYSLKELKPKYHQGVIIYLIRSKIITASKLRKCALKTNIEHVLSEIKICPF